MTVPGSRRRSHRGCSTASPASARRARHRRGAVTTASDSRWSPTSRPTTTAGLPSPIDQMVNKAPSSPSPCPSTNRAAPGFQTVIPARSCPLLNAEPRTVGRRRAGSRGRSQRPVRAGAQDLVFRVAGPQRVLGLQRGHGGVRRGRDGWCRRWLRRGRSGAPGLQRPGRRGAGADLSASSNVYV